MRIPAMDRQPRVKGQVKGRVKGRFKGQFKGQKPLGFKPEGLLSQIIVNHYGTTVI